MKISRTKFNKKLYFLENSTFISSLGEYQDYIGYLDKSWSPDSELWFRGVSDSRFDLVPSVYRKNVWDYDEEVAKDFANDIIHHAKGHLSNAHLIGVWEWYQIMQHFNVPTRLLDWTSGHLIALYFACRYAEVKQVSVPSVWVINPFDLNGLSLKISSIFYTDKLTRDKQDNVVDKYLFNSTKLPEYPIAILPPYVNERMSTQKSCFTVHGTFKNGFVELYKKNKSLELAKLKISPTKAYQIKCDLVSAGITEATLFPDLEGVARELRFEYKMKQ